ncbi:MAG: hypothetical protein AB1772_05635 [Candidatus Zixiibacteriota bacterium]
MSRFDIVQGQSKAWTILARAHAAGKVASTYLFHGPEGVGAWSLAIEFAALLNCESPLGTPDRPDTRRPCGECRNCRLVHDLNFEGLHLIVPLPPHKEQADSGTVVDEAGRVARGKARADDDDEVPEDTIGLTNLVLKSKREEPFALLDRARSISIPIELARKVKRQLSVRGPAGIVRVVVFYQMDTMRPVSADALLKLIEEPPTDTVIILTALNPDKILPTILSRAQKIRLDRLPEPMIVRYLVEKYKVSETEARRAARVTERSLGRAISILPVEGEERSDTREIAWILFRALVHGSASELVGRMSESLNFRDRGQAQELVLAWQSLLRDCAWMAHTGDDAELVNVDHTHEISEMAVRFGDASAVQRMIVTTKNTLADLQLNVHIQPALLAMALKLKVDLQPDGKAAARRI